MALDMLLAGPSTIVILLFSWAILKVKPNSVTDRGPFCPISRITWPNVVHIAQNQIIITRQKSYSNVQVQIPHL